MVAALVIPDSPAIGTETGVPGIKDAYGVGRGKLYYEPADAALPSVTGWDTRKALNRAKYGKADEAFNSADDRLRDMYLGALREDQQALATAKGAGAAFDEAQSASRAQDRADVHLPVVLAPQRSQKFVLPLWHKPYRRPAPDVLHHRHR